MFPTVIGFCRSKAVISRRGLRPVNPSKRAHKWLKCVTLQENGLHGGKAYYEAHKVIYAYIYILGNVM